MSEDIAALVSGNLEVWTGAIERRSSAGRGNGKRVGLYGIEQLRKLILDLAVRGKLVPQNAEDESAASLITLIRKQQADLIKAGEISKARKVPPPSDLPPFEIPATWKWLQIAEIGHDWGQRKPKNDFTYIDVGSIDQAAGVIRAPNILAATDAPSRARKNLHFGTVIYSTVRPYLLNIAVVDREFEPEPIASTAFAVVHPFDGIESGFIYRYLRSPAFVQYVESCQTGIAYPAINDRQFFSAWFPLPPTAEQRRIVAKVDGLMALCDALEAQSASALEAHQSLVETLLATLINATDAAELARQWGRLETHFDALFTTEASIDALKQTVIELAVRGRLVSQNPNEAGVQLPNFREVSKSSEWDERVFDYGRKLLVLPNNWKFAPVAQLASHVVDCPHTTPKWTQAGEMCVRTNQIKPRHLDLSQPNYVSIETYVERIERLEPKGGDILYIREGGILGVGCRIPEGVRLCLGQRSMLIRCTPAITPEYMEVVLNSPFMVDLAKHFTTGGAAPRVNMSTVRGYPIPTPPLAEQRRIVAKVEELIVLCDAMKARLIDAAETQMHLANAIVERAAA